jgi:CDP-glycerol glycerophosphotransferase
VPLISVVVPVYNVEEYLPACLESIARQTEGDLEVLVIDDGSTDRSGEIAAEFAARDQRFRVITKENGGLSSARNAGAEAAAGEYLMFVDSDDLLPLDALERLVTSLKKTGSDFATGNVQRLTVQGTTPTRFLAKAFERDRPKTHVTKFPELLTDRIAPNKLWRRSFWESNGFRFPEGRVYEDIPVVLPAHYAARSVDVLAEPVYLYRIREGADLSITQRRLEKSALLNRVQAVEEARDHLAEQGAKKTKLQYEQSVVRADFSYFLNVLGNADDEYRELFLERVNAFLDDAAGDLYHDLPAIDRLKWHLVRRRLLPELLEVLRFQAERLRETPPVRVGRRWYGDYPFRTDERLNIPESVYRLDEELALSPRVDDLRFEGDELKIGGYAFIAGIGAPERDSQRVTITMVRRGRFRRIRMRTSAIRLRASVRHRPEVTASVSQAADVQWSGFEATLPPGKLKALGRWRPGTWDLYVTVQAGGITRRRSRFYVDGPRPVRATDRRLDDGVRLVAAPAPRGEIAVRVETNWAEFTGRRLGEDALELSGVMHGGGAALRLSRVGSQKLEFPLERGADGAFAVSIPYAELEETVRIADPEPHGAEHGQGMVWNLWLIDGKERRRMGLDPALGEAAWPAAGQELVLMRDKDGNAVLVARTPQPHVTDARWLDGGELELSGELLPGERLHELVLVRHPTLRRHTFPVEAGDGRFTARLALARLPSLAGELPLQEGRWELSARAEPGAPPALVMIAQHLYERLPLTTTVDHKNLMLGITAEQNGVVIAQRDLDGADERGRFHQGRLREGVYRPGRERPLRDAVVYASFGGRGGAGNPQAIHEELRRRGADLEHLWVVRDGRCSAPPGATALRADSREHYEAMATARFLVSDDFFPEWFTRREDQVCVQTLHGTPLKRVGLDVPHLRSTIRRSWRWNEQVAGWQYVLSPNAFSTPIIERAFGVRGELLDTGMPRNDLLAGPDAESRREQVRRRLGLGEGTRVLLYAPTMRDHVLDRHGNYRLDLRVDLERLREAAGPDAVVLFRNHPKVEDPLGTGEQGPVRDVSAYPSVAELLLAADVLVTDYSTLMFDFAITGRPLLFLTYDLDRYEHEIRGFYIDFRSQAPGPLLQTGDELIDAVRALGDGVPAGYEERYAEFRSSYTPLDDGAAAGRVVERVFSPTEGRTAPPAGSRSR